MKHGTVCEVLDDNSVQVRLHRRGNTHHPFFSLQGQDRYIQCCLYIILCLKHTTQHCKPKTLIFSLVLVAVPCEIQKLLSVLIKVESKLQQLFLFWIVARRCQFIPQINVHPLWSNRRAGLVLMLNTKSASWNLATARATWPWGLQK